MDRFDSCFGRLCEATLSGMPPMIGTLVDAGPDMIVFYSGGRFHYMPLHHLKSLSAAVPGPDGEQEASDPPALPPNVEPPAYKTTLQHAVGLFVEITVGSGTLYGSITGVMDDYFAFRTPALQETVFIPMEHLKCIVPYPPSHRPFGLPSGRFTSVPSAAAYPPKRKFAHLLRAMTGEFMVWDLESGTRKHGVLASVREPVVELVNADGKSVYHLIRHVKSAYFSPRRHEPPEKEVPE